MFQFIPQEGLYKGMETVSDFDVRVVKKITTLTLGQTSNEHFVSNTSYIIIAITKDNEKLPERWVSSLNKLDYFSLWPQIIDADLTRRQKTLLKMRLQQSASEAEEEQIICATKPGIYRVKEDLPPIYISGEQVITSDTASYMPVSFKNALTGTGKWDIITDYPFITYDLLKKYMRIAPGTSEIICFSVLLGVVKPFFVEAGINPNLCINLYGESGSYKTSLVKATSFLGHSELPYIGSMLNDRKSNVLKAIDAAYGRLYLLDDYHPGVSKQKKDRQIDLMDAVIRHLETNPYTAVVIMTSEFLDGCYSTQDRMLQISMTDVNLDLLSKMQSEQSFLPTIAYELVKSLLNCYDEALSYILTLYRELEKQQKSNTRASRYSIYLKIVAELLKKYLYNGMDSEVSFQNLDEALSKQIAIQEDHMKHIRRLESNEDIIKVLCKILDSGIYNVCTKIDGSYTAARNQIFVKDQVYVYITKPALQYGLRQYFKCEFHSLSKLIAILSEAGILCEDTDATTKKGPHHSGRHICISRYAMDQYINSISYTPLKPQ